MSTGQPQLGAILPTPRDNEKVVVVGAGSFGTAMATVAARNNSEVVLVGRDEEQAAHINSHRRNPRYLSDFELPSNLTATTDLASALEGASYIIHAIPAQKTPSWLRENKDLIPADMLICSTSKGLYVQDQKLLGDAMVDALGREQPIAFLSGPSFAKELMAEQPSAVVVASKLLYNAVKVQRSLSTLYFRVYTTQDIVGVQLGGALKNPLAIGAGMIEGKGLGINTLSAYVTRSSLELQKLCIAMGGQPETISGLSGIGDLMLTAFGGLSRNRRCGSRLAKGENIEDICKDYTVEGVPTSAVAIHFADMCGLEVPIFRVVDGVIQGTIKIDDAQELLMGRPLSMESR